jgi:hypothetical protein
VSACVMEPLGDVLTGEGLPARKRNGEADAFS